MVLPGAETLDKQGYALVLDVLDAMACEALASRCALALANVAPRDLLALPWCSDLVARLRAHAGLAALVPAGHVAVQCTYFEKSAQHNWLVALHQDLSIPVARRVQAPGWDGWSMKDGQLFVQPPAAVLRHMVALRLHLDDCGIEDGPLRLVPGSHREGIVPAGRAAELRAEFGEVVAVAPMGAALLMSPLLLHASSKARGSGRRRVLHFLFGPPQLPLDVQWAHRV